MINDSGGGPGKLYKGDRVTNGRRTSQDMYRVMPAIAAWGRLSRRAILKVWGMDDGSGIVAEVRKVFMCS